MYSDINNAQMIRCQKVAGTRCLGAMSILDNRQTQRDSLKSLQSSKEYSVQNYHLPSTNVSKLPPTPTNVVWDVRFWAIQIGYKNWV